MTEQETAHFETQFARGVELFNTKEFFDCHDVFEELWQEERGELKLFLQGLIQAAVGSYHLSNGNTTGAISQYTKSLAKLDQFGDDYCNLEMKTFRDEIRRCLLGAEMMLASGASYEVAGEYFPLLRTIGNETI